MGHYSAYPRVKLDSLYVRLSSAGFLPKSLFRSCWTYLTRRRVFPSRFVVCGLLSLHAFECATVRLCCFFNPFKLCVHDSTRRGKKKKKMSYAYVVQLPQIHISIHTHTNTNDTHRRGIQVSWQVCWPFLQKWGLISVDS